MNPCPHMGTVIYTTVLAVGGCSFLPVGLLLVGHSGHWCGCSKRLGCAHTTVSVGAATERRVAKDMTLHVQYLLKSILCNSHE